MITRRERHRDRFEIDVALKNREFELSLFWQRSNYFLVLNTALGFAAFSTQDRIIGILLSLFGVAVSWLWYRTNLGSRFWQVFWEAEVERLATRHNLRSFELSVSSARDQVRASMDPKPGFWRRQIDRGVLEKPSVTIHMIYLSLLVLVFWVCAFAYFCWAAVTPPASQQVNWNLLLLDVENAIPLIPWRW